MHTESSDKVLKLTTRQRELSLELRRSQALFCSILDTAGEAFVTCDGHGRVELFNAAAERVFGIGPTIAIGSELSTLLRSAKGEDLHFEDLARDAKLQFQGRGLRGDGTEFQAEVSLSGLEVHDRTMRILVIQDVTERRELEAQRHQTQHLESIGQLAAGIAHEINTPTQFVGDNVRFLRDSVTEMLEGLEAAAKTVGTLLEDAGLDEARRASLGELAEELEELDLEFLVEEVPQAIAQSINGIERVGKIVQAMRNFSHPGSMGKAPTDLNQCIENTCTVSSSAWKYQAELALELAVDLPKVECSESEVNQVILNLVVNGAHAIEARRAEGDPLGTLCIKTSADDAGVRIDVTDDGCGMPPEVKQRVFEPFFTTKGVGKGTGQGLALAHNVATAHGGHIEVESSPGAGTCFSLSLPLKQS